MVSCPSLSTGGRLFTTMGRGNAHAPCREVPIDGGRVAVILPNDSEVAGAKLIEDARRNSVAGFLTRPDDSETVPIDGVACKRDGRLAGVDLSHPVPPPR